MGPLSQETFIARVMTHARETAGTDGEPGCLWERGRGVALVERKGQGIDVYYDVTLWEWEFSDVKTGAADYPLRQGNLAQGIARLPSGFFGREPRTYAWISHAAKAYLHPLRKEAKMFRRHPKHDM